METLQRKSTSIEGNTVVTHHSAGGGCGHPVRNWLSTLSPSHGALEYCSDDVG